MKKTISGLIIILFSYFAYVQLNDSDGSKWILIYGSIILLSLLSIIGFNKYKIYNFAFLIFSILLILNSKLLFDWFQAGQPAFIDYKPTQIVEVEKIREFLGLFLCFIASFYIMITSKKD